MRDTRCHLGGIHDVKQPVGVARIAVVHAEHVGEVASPSGKTAACILARWGLKPRHGVDTSSGLRPNSVEFVDAERWSMGVDHRSNRPGKLGGALS